MAYPQGGLIYAHMRSYVILLADCTMYIIYLGFDAFLVMYTLKTIWGDPGDRNQREEEIEPQEKKIDIYINISLLSTCRPVVFRGLWATGTSLARKVMRIRPGY